MDAILRSIGILQQMSIGEVFAKKKHICPNRQQQSKPTTTTTTPPTRSTYYHKKPWSNTQPKPKMSNSCELLIGPIQDIQRKYEIVSDIVIVEYNGKVHGSQRERFKYWPY